MIRYELFRVYRDCEDRVFVEDVDAATDSTGQGLFWWSTREANWKQELGGCQFSAGTKTELLRKVNRNLDDDGGTGSLRYFGTRAGAERYANKIK
jgi:hypothetical protein